MAFLTVLTIFLALVGGTAYVLLPKYPLSFVGIAVLLSVIYIAVFVVPSFRLDLMRRVGVRLVSFYLATFAKTYVTGHDRRELAARYRKATRLPELRRYLGRGMGWLGLPDIVYLQWPFYSTLLATTADLRIPIAATDGVWTTEQEIYRVLRKTLKITKITQGQGNNRKEVEIRREEKTEEGEWKIDTPADRKPSGTKEKRVEKPADGSTVETRVETEVETHAIPRIQLLVNGEIFIRLGVSLGPFILAFPDAPLDRQSKEGEKEGLQEYLSRSIQPLIFEAVRTAVSGFTKRQTGVTVPGLTWEGLADAVKSRRDIEVRVREILGSQPESILIQSGLLREWDQNADTSDSGQAAAAFDVVIENILPKDADLQKAIDGVAVALKKAEGARYEGEATRYRERGLTDALEERSNRLGVSGETTLGHDFGKATKPDLTLIGSDVGTMLATILRGLKRN